MTEREKMLKGLPYRPNDPELINLRMLVRDSMALFNNPGPRSADGRKLLLKEMLGKLGIESWIEPPFYCDYGCNIEIGRNFYMNFDGLMLDVCPIVIGDYVMCGPKVQFLSATHSVNAEERNFSGTELGKPIYIDDQVWIGGGAVICPGVRIGAKAVIGAGSVVTRDIPESCVAVGNPCRVIRKIDQSSGRNF